MATAKPTFEEYIEWLRTDQSVVIDDATINNYDVAASTIRNHFWSSAFWQEFVAGRILKNFDEQYQIDHHGYALLLNNEKPPDLDTKSADSFFSKTYRINVLNNRFWPRHPPRWQGKEQWILPDNWLTEINDIVRTCFVVKYFDGVKYLAAKIKELATKHGLEMETSFEAREEGYYAAHLYVNFEAEVVGLDWRTKKITTRVELQITTQLQDVIRRMLHQHYEERRMSFPENKKDEWKWNQKSNEFATNYLGHILHYLEGMIVEIRDRPKEEN